MAEAGIALVYGGGNFGIMGALSQSVIAHGGHVTGIIPEHLVKIEVANGDVHDLVIVGSMHERKRRMFDISDAIAILPGGLGTLDETFEILTWRQLGLHDKPVYIVNEGGYWQSLLALIDDLIVKGFAKPKIRNLFQVVPDVTELAFLLRKARSAPSCAPERF